jgi:hypothetical protein
MNQTILKCYHNEPDGTISIDPDPLSDDQKRKVITREQFELLKKMMPNTLWLNTDIN